MNLQVVGDILRIPRCSGDPLKLARVPKDVPGVHITEIQGGESRLHTRNPKPNLRGFAVFLESCPFKCNTMKVWLRSATSGTGRTPDNLTSTLNPKPSILSPKPFARNLC